LDSSSEPGGGRALLARSWPVSAAELTWGVQWYAGVILLGFLAAPSDVAWQSASLRLVLAIHTGVWLYLYVLLPGLARVVVADPDAWRRLVDASLRVTSWAGCWIALVVALAAETLLRTVFGDGFTASAPLLRVMIWVIPVAWMSGHLRYSLIAAEHPRKDCHAAFVGAATTVLLTLGLVPSLLSLGAGIALLCGTVANAIAAWILARKTLPTFTVPRSAAQSAVWCLAAVALGTVLTPVVGDLRSTAMAGVFFGAAGLVVERKNVAGLLHSVSAGLLAKSEVKC
jgi:O-antigen/teichoic acid export membrane protein